jgi:uncharacterized membrane-anchored protein
MRAVSRGLAVCVVWAASTVAADPLAKVEPEAPLAPDALHWQAGPRKLDLGHEIALDLPATYLFLGMPDADRLMQKLGNLANQNLLGLVVPADEQQGWVITVRYNEDGHIDDGEQIDATALLDTIRESTEQGNDERIKRSFKANHVTGWFESPRYDRERHRLVWGLLIKSDGDESQMLNYNTHVLGRRGVLALDLVTPPERLPVDRVHAAAAIEAAHFRKGARYEDFDKKTDKVAEYGLVGLILGGAGLGAAKLVKIGLLAKFWKVILAALIAGKKAIAAFLLLVLGGIKRLFGGKKRERAAPGRGEGEAGGGDDGPTIPSR